MIQMKCWMGCPIKIYLALESIDNIFGMAAAFKEPDNVHSDKVEEECENGDGSKINLD